MSDNAVPHPQSPLHSPSHPSPSSRSASPEPQMEPQFQTQPSSSSRRDRGRSQPQPSFDQQQLQQHNSPSSGKTRAGQVLGNNLGQVGGSGWQQGGQKKEALKLRLDLNLDVDVQIKARVHGDVTLSLL
ncbi:hypothetical protein C8J57DRAFT_1251658 [Mycena rebaudengoi]|nr:hypothetical protein C8J57DRAFT_1251658 [Mycena rebaudengoi]